MISVISYISKDIIIKPGSVIEKKIGGTGYYAGIALAKLGKSTNLYIHAEAESDDLLKLIDEKNLKVYKIVSETYKYPRFYNVFLDKSLNNRIFKADLSSFFYDYEFFNEEMKESLSDSEYIHLAPASHTNLTEIFMGTLKTGKAKLSAELQFLIKSVDSDGNQNSVNKDQFYSLIRFFDIVNISIEDLHFLKINNSIHNVLIEISKMGPHEIILTLGSKGSLIYSAKENKFYEINPIKPKKIIDPVGCGDTYIASYLYARSNHYCIEDAGNFAAKIASHKLGQKGAYSGNIKNTIINT